MNELQFLLEREVMIVEFDNTKLAKKFGKYQSLQLEIQVVTL
jgi:hypothetical protein